MALRTIGRLGKNYVSVTYSRTNIIPMSLSDTLPMLSQYRNYHNGRNNNHEKNQSNDNKWGYRIPLAAGLGVSASATIFGLHSKRVNDDENDETSMKSKLFGRHHLSAEESYEKKIVAAEMIYRRTQHLDKIFDYFASYRYINKNGKAVNLMSVRDFYNAISPGSLITHGTGLKSEKDYIIISEDDLVSDKLYQKEELPVPNSTLNKVQKQGLISFTDFCFMINILAIPLRYMDVAFLAFYIIADGNMHANEYLKVMTKITKHTGGLRRFDDCGTYEELIRNKYSGLMNHLFGKNRNKAMQRDKFLKFRGQIIDDILWLEFQRHCKTLPNLPKMPPQQFPIMTDLQFCEHLLENTTFPAKKKAQMLARVTKFFGESASNPTQLCEAITFDMFKSFYHVLYCGADLERAMYFRDLDNGGITKDEFMEFSKSISDVEVDSHIVDVVFLLLDQEGLITQEGLLTKARKDGLLSKEHFSPLLAEWRLSRAFKQASDPGAAVIDLKLT